ncbi:chitin synthase-domain-containing protein, partial [Dimargaris cristalligena]
LRRGKTLIRPERQQAPDRMVTGHGEKSGGVWPIFAKVVSFWCPGFILAKLGMGDKSMQQAWREKFALCFIICLICAAVVYLTLFFTTTFCRSTDVQVQDNVLEISPGMTNTVNYLGRAYTITPENYPRDPKPTAGEDLTNLFVRVQPTDCQSFEQKYAAVRLDTCDANNGLGGCPFPTITDAIAQGWIKDEVRLIGWGWDNVSKGSFVVDGNVLNLTPYLNITTNPITDDPVDQAIRIAAEYDHFDATLLFYRTDSLKALIPCLTQKYFAGKLAKSTMGCFAVNLFNYVALVVILGLVLIKFFMALTFSWILSFQLVRRKTGAKPIMASSSTPWAKKNNTTSGAIIQSDAASDELFTLLLVTCYSEGEDSIRTTVESLASTDYSDSRKLLFIIADGMITGSGNDRSTPEICVDLIEVDPLFADPQPCSYIAIADGGKQLNMAKVYAGHYPYKNRRIPTVVVVKCGGPAEQDKPKAGNRGKRDSQIILMNFFSRVIYNDRMTPLDYDLFRKVHHLMGVTPDLFEIVLMVDADTKVYPDSLRLLVNCMNNDPLIMGLCGETKIANKRESWVTWIQVYEYYISHHLGKAFESVFGGVTCLPGCFCMYRLKAPKGESDWVPIITKPEIIQEYSQNVVHTLHEKNLLLLGEDRFLTTLMLRNFPHRKMMFMPQAVCKTVVPDEFKVLLSQRRRWINSTIHNLMELVLVRNLCGTFCFSMQFVVFLDLTGTVVLPVAIAMTFVLLVQLFRTAYDSFASYLPLIMLFAVLFLPGILILITTRKWIYLAWMFVYLLALPVWNFILPVYAYWHFDDFSWGETRKVDGEAKGDDHSKKEGEFDGSKVPLRRWEDYERRRLRSIKRKERRRQ